MLFVHLILKLPEDEKKAVADSTNEKQIFLKEMGSSWHSAKQNMHNQFLQWFTTEEFTKVVVTNS